MNAALHCLHTGLLPLELHDAHVIERTAILDARQHCAHVGAWIRHHVRQLARRPIADGFKPAALHEYADADGVPLFWRIRLKRADGEKWIRPLRRLDGGGFELKQPDYPDGAPLYRLPDLTARPDAMVWITEGETCADALASLGMVATTTGGAESAGRANFAPLAGRAVAIWPDNDDPGLRYADTLLILLRDLGCTVAVIDPAALDLPHKGDCVDWLAAHPGATADEVRALLPVGGNEAATAGGEVTAMPDAPETDDARIARLSAMPALDYDRCREREAKAMGVRTPTLDRLVKAANTDDAQETPFSEPEPWPHPVNPAALLTEIAETVRRFIILEPKQADAAALWIAFTWFTDAVEVAPLAIINAPEKSCGKSQLLTVLGKLSCRAIQANNMRPATLFRIVDRWNPALFIDECDTFINSDEEIPGLINAGHTRDSSNVWRCVGDNHDVTPFNVWGAKALAGIALEKHLPDATLSRAVIFNMRRKLAGETVQRLRHADAGLFERLASMLARFADDARDLVRAARPALPDALGDRDQDNWEPLLSIAECAGDDWLRRATVAALELSGASDGAQSAGNELLADIQTAFEGKRVDRISTADLIAALVEDEEAAWATWNKGRPLAPRQLARMLKQYGIASKNVRMGYEQSKGFDRHQFNDAFARYLATPENLRPGVPMPANPMNTGRDAGRNEKPGTCEETASVTLEPAWIKARDEGTDKTPILGEGANATDADDVEVF